MIAAVVMFSANLAHVTYKLCDVNCLSLSMVKSSAVKGVRLLENYLQDWPKMSPHSVCYYLH